MNILQKYSTTSSILFFTLSLNACAGVKVWPEKTGQVLDETTNQPIAGAIVVALWEGHRNQAFIKTRRVCYHVETTTTDQQGRYTFDSRFDGLMRSQIYDKYISYSVYKEGYEYSVKTHEKEAYKKNIKYIRRHKATRVAKILNAEKFMRMTSCHSTDRSITKLFPVYDQIYKDISHLGLEKEKNRWFLWMISSAAINVDENMTSKEARQIREKFLKGYLQQ